MDNDLYFNSIRLYSQTAWRYNRGTCVKRGNNMPGDNIMRQLAEFAADTKWDALPPPIAHETKLLLMDSIGCALAALATDKGKMNLSLAKRYGGPPEASVIGTRDKVSLPTAAMVNGELMFTLDFTAIGSRRQRAVLCYPRDSGNGRKRRSIR